MRAFNRLVPEINSLPLQPVIVPEYLYVTRADVGNGGPFEEQVVFVTTDCKRYRFEALCIGFGEAFSAEEHARALTSVAETERFKRGRRGAAEKRCESLLVPGKKLSQRSLKALIADVGDAVDDRRGLAEVLHGELAGDASPSQRLARHRVAREVLLGLARDADPGVREEGLFAIRTVADQLFQIGELAESLEYFETLADADLQVMPVRFRRWVARLAAGDVAGAETDGGWLFPGRYDISNEVYGRCLAAEELLDSDPAERDPLRATLVRRVLEPVRGSVADDEHALFRDLWKRAQERG